MSNRTPQGIMIDSLAAQCNIFGVLQENHEAMASKIDDPSIEQTHHEIIELLESLKAKYTVLLRQYNYFSGEGMAKEVKLSAHAGDLQIESARQEPTRPTAKHLRSQLDEYQLIVEVNEELFDRNAPTRNDLAANFMALQVLLDQLERSGEQVDNSIMLDDANQIISEIRHRIKLILSQNDPLK